MNTPNDTNDNEQSAGIPLVSFIMAAKNFEQFIDGAINSVMGQTYRNIELMVVDDASTDGTTDIICKWAQKDPRVRPIYNKESVLPPIARNMAAAQARGKYLAILDSDDISMPERIQVQVDFMEAHPEMSAACSHAELIDIRGKSLGIKKKSVRIPDIRFAMLLQSQFIHSSMIIRKSVFDSLGGYRPEYMHAEDYDICSRILETGLMNNIDAVLIKFRVNSGGVTTLSDSKKIQAESSLKVTLRNCAPYISLSPKLTKELTDTMNNKDISLFKILRALHNYKKLTEVYLRKNTLTHEDASSIRGIYKGKARTICAEYVKRRLGTLGLSR